MYTTQNAPYTESTLAVVIQNNV